jgi:hypothetical protein
LVQASASGLVAARAVLAGESKGEER